MALLIWIVCLVIQNQFQAKRHAMIVKTHSDERFIATLLEEQAITIGGLTNLNQEFVLSVVFADQRNHIWILTNAASELMDIWQTPYRIELAGPTNFVISSAGKDKIFGDADDIIFNSVSSDFVMH